MTLVQLGYFGKPHGRGTSLKDLLLEAWEDYKAWCKLNGIIPAQGRFTPNLVSWQHAAIWESWRPIMKLKVHDVFFYTSEFGLIWRQQLQMRRTCSIYHLQNKVVKACHGAYLTAKAFNGRIIVDWLRDCAERAHSGSLPNEGSRRFGCWLKSEVRAGHCDWPVDNRLLHQRLAMIPNCNLKSSF